MALIDWMAYYLAFDKSVFKIVPLERNKSGRFTSLIWAMGLYVVFIFGANLITSYFSVVESAEYASIFEYISALIATTFSATPILYGSSYLRLAVWGLLIPLIETRFFFRTLLQWAVRAAGVKWPSSAFSMSALMIEGFFGAIFAVFHIVAKGITNNPALVVTFLFGVLSAGMVIHFKQLLEAIFLHVITNTIATMQQLGMGFFSAGTVGFNTAGVAILGGVLVVVWLLLFQSLPFIKDRSVST